MKLLIVIFLLSTICYPQSEDKVRNHPYSGTLVLSAGGGIGIGHTDLADGKPGFSGTGMIEYFIPAYSRNIFGFRLQFNAASIGGSRTVVSPGYKTDIYSIGTGISYLFSVEDVVFPYLMGGVSFVKFFPHTLEGTAAPNHVLDLYSTTSFVYNLEAGTRFLLASDISLYISMNYNFLQSDYLEDIAYGGKDKYITINGGVSFSLFGNSDSDDDGIYDNIDLCPDQKEDFDGFEDEDGCPDVDNDNDGIYDQRDQCPDLAEDPDGFEDHDGCPDTDNDNDGIIDSIDNCANIPEDFDGFEDEDGCPDFDNDNDGISDELDRCPNSPEDLDGFEDSDGCPDLDNDNDGILDVDDKCPNHAETFNNFEDYDGCPDTTPIMDESQIINEQSPRHSQMPQPSLPAQVPQITAQRRLPANKPVVNNFLLEEYRTFKNDKSEIKPEAYDQLDKIAEIMKQNPDHKWRIEGHVDRGNLLPNIGSWRAKEVMLYLVKKGVPLSQLEAVDLKDRYPRASNQKPSGKALNRRVEIQRVK
ncbi:MAG: OmpA family protein [Ignavibacteriaceae bacterium]